VAVGDRRREPFAATMHQFRTARMLERFDANKDGKLGKNEVGDERMWTRLVAADKNGDGMVSKATGGHARR
jgi:EF hand